VASEKLLQSCQEGDSDTVKSLLDQGADPNYTDSRGLAALGLACYFDDPQLVRLLLDYRANVDHQAHRGFSGLMIATSRGLHEVVSVLLQHGANPLLKLAPDSDKTALEYASDEKIYSMLCTVIEANNEFFQVTTPL
jgi:ankyrin repeat protein